MFRNRIVLYKECGVVYTTCPFCDGGYIPLDIEHLYDDNEIKVKGKCKKCMSYIQVRTNSRNFVSNWDHTVLYDVNEEK